MTKEQLLRKKQNSNKSNKIEIIDLINKIIPIAILIGTVVSILYYYNKFNLFGISINFFSYDLSFAIVRSIIYMIIFVIGIIICFVEKFGKLGKFIKFIYSIMLILSLCATVDYTIRHNLFYYIRIFLIIGFFLYFVMSKKDKFKKFIMLIVVYFIFEIAYMIFLGKFGIRELSYSILKQENKEEKIVLLKSGDKVFVADFYVNGNNECTIYTKNYEIRKYENIKVENRVFSDVIVDKEHTKEEAREQAIKTKTKISTEITEQTTK